MKKYYLSIITIILFTLSTIFINASDFTMVPQGADADMVNQIEISPDSKYFAYIQGTSIYKVKLCTMEGKMITTIPLPQVGMVSITFSADSKKLIITIRTNIFIYDINGILIKTIGSKDNTSYPNYYGVPACSPDGEIIATGLFDNTGYKNFWGIAFYNFEGKEIKRLSGFSQQITRCAFSPDGNIFGAISYDKKLNLYDKNGNLIRSITGLTGFEHQLIFSPDSKIIFTSDFTSIKIFNTNGILLKTIDTSKTGGAVLSNDQKTLFFRSFDQNLNQFIKLTDINNKEKKRLYGLPSNAIKFVITPSNTHLITSLQNGLIQIFNINNGKSMILASKDDDWITYTNEGFFDCSPIGSKIVAMVKGMDAAGVDQFAIKYNRPDIILKQLDLGSTEQINYYNYLFQKRLKKFNLSENQLSNQLEVPEIKIIDTVTNNKKVIVTFKLLDKKHKIIYYNIFINDIPIIINKQINIAPNNEKQLSEEIELNAGDNKIEISCINDIGAESYRALTYAAYKNKVKENLYFIGFGVSKYRNKELNLNYAAKDVIDLEKIFKSMKSNYDNVYTKIFVDKDVTIANIKKAKELLNNSKIDDTFVLFIAGHGVHDTDKNFTYYFLTHNTDLNNLNKTSAPFNLIENILYDIPPRNKIFLMDTCESGEIEEEREENYFYLSNVRGIKARSIRGLSRVSANKTGQKVSRTFLLERDRYIYNDLVRRSGTIIFSSLKGGEFSYEKDEFENGLFTEEILNALTKANSDKDRDGFISTDELREYVIKAVSKTSNDLQHPTVDRDNIYQKFKFPITKK
jgi:WD40 repeat protein